MTQPPRNNVAAVLGGCGFVGSALVRKLLDDGQYERVIVVDNLSSGSKSLLPKHPRLEDPIESDVRDLSLRAIGLPADVFYLCGAPFVPTSWSQPDATKDSNVQVLRDFLDRNAEMADSFRLVYASSGE